MTPEEMDGVSAGNLAAAKEVLASGKVLEILRDGNTCADLVGSVRTGLIAKHLDIDIHFYTSVLDEARSFEIMGRVAKNLNAESASFKNLSDTEEKCLEWHMRCADSRGRPWTLDIINILEGSKYDGYFESVADRIKSMLTPQKRADILALKFAAPDSEKICGIEFCAAVLIYGVRSLGEFMCWRINHPLSEAKSWFI